MAQIIKKFASGGSYGTFTRNGKTYKVNDKLLTHEILKETIYIK